MLFLFLVLLFVFGFGLCVFVVCSCQLKWQRKAKKGCKKTIGESNEGGGGWDLVDEKQTLGSKLGLDCVYVKAVMRKECRCQRQSSANWAREGHGPLLTSCAQECQNLLAANTAME